METNTKKLHPLLAAAAGSLIIFSAVGVAAITGILPTSKGSVTEQSPVAAAETQQAPAAVPEAPAPVKPKPVKKHVAKKLPEPAQAPAPVAYAGYPPLAQAPQAPVVKPGLLGTVQSVREVTKAGDAKGVGAVGGGVAGAVLGHNIGEHNKLVTILGAAGGALLGNQIEKQTRATRHWELTVRYDDGTSQVFNSDTQPYWHQGDRVRLLEGRLQPV
jgi:outer membrane lipoprotein SlyB